MFILSAAPTQLWAVGGCSGWDSSHVPRRSNHMHDHVSVFYSVRVFIWSQWPAAPAGATRPRSCVWLFAAAAAAAAAAARWFAALQQQLPATRSAGPTWYNCDCCRYCCRCRCSSQAQEEADSQARGQANQVSLVENYSFIHLFICFLNSFLS